MVSPLALWLPILVSAVAVFVASSLVHMVLHYHNSDFRSLPDEDGVMDALRPFAVPPGEYMFPRVESMKEMKSPEFIAKWKRGPVAMLTVMPAGEMGMAKSLTLWFVYLLAISAVAGVVAGRAVAAGGESRTVFHLTGMTAFVAYAAALWQSSIWYHRPWRTTLKSTIDGLIYGLVTGAVFGWLWP